MKLENGKNWYKLDLLNYNNDFLIEIIEDLELKLISKQYQKCPNCNKIVKLELTDEK